MILDSLANGRICRSLHPRMGLAFDYLEKFDPATADGRVSLAGDDVFALVQSYRPKLSTQGVFESHRAYIDVQFVAAGREIIFWSPLDLLRETTPYSAEKDAALYSGTDDSPLHLRTGDFAVLFPQDGHKPCCLWREGDSPVKKVVVKVRAWPLP